MDHLTARERSRWEKQTWEKRGEDWFINGILQKVTSKRLKLALTGSHSMMMVHSRATESNQVEALRVARVLAATRALVLERAMRLAI